MTEYYVSIDIETDGPAPGINSMLALGAVVFSPDGDLLATWYNNLLPLPGAYQDTDTMDWWTTQPEAWAAVNLDRRDPGKAIQDFVSWCAVLPPGKLVAVGRPIAFDFAFLNYYCHRFALRNPLGFAGLDIRSYASGLACREGYYDLPEEVVRQMAGKVDTEGLKDHVALDDAIGQGRLFMALRKHAAEKRWLCSD